MSNVLSPSLNISNALKSPSTNPKKEFNINLSTPPNKNGDLVSPTRILSPNRSLMSPSKKSGRYDTTPNAKFWRDPNAQDKRRSFFQSPDPLMTTFTTGVKHENRPISHHLTESIYDPRSPTVPRSPALALSNIPISKNASALLTLNNMYKGGMIDLVEKSLLKALIIREDDLVYHLLDRQAKGDENALPAIKEMLHELQSPQEYNNYDKEN